MYEQSVDCRTVTSHQGNYIKSFREMPLDGVSRGGGDTPASAAQAALYLSPLEVDCCDDIAVLKLLIVAVTFIVTVYHVSQDRRAGAKTPGRLYRVPQRGFS